MSYQSKRTITSLVTGIVILAAYCVSTLGKYSINTSKEGDLKALAGAMLAFIVIGIISQIIIQIIFHIVLSIGIAVKDRDFKEQDINRKIEAAVIEDEMDKLIGLKSLRIGFVIAGAGFVAALIAVALGWSMIIALNTMYLSFMAGSIIEGFASLYFYGKGVRNG